MSEEIDGAKFRQVMGSYPTGVTVVTAMDGDDPVAMVIGSFVSVSLDPPLVGFLPGKTSRTWPQIEGSGAFCVNVMGDDQLDLCNSFFKKEVDPFTTCNWTTGETGSPVIEGALATIDCHIHEVVDAGDHVMVFGRVTDMDCADDGKPLVFFGGGYGTFGELA